jgi:diguanylate cyclase (GGDEF)-like protein
MIDNALPAPHRPASVPLHDAGTDMVRLNQLLSSGFRSLRFPADLEARFLQDSSEQRLHHFLISGVISLLVYNGFLLVDYLMAADVFWLAVRIRLFIFTPLSIVALYASWRWARQLPKAVWPVLSEIVVLVSGLIAAASLAFILSATHSAMSHYYHVGFVVVIMYGNIVQRVRFWYAVLFSLSVLAIHVGGIFLLSTLPPQLLWPIVMMVLGTVVFTLYANYAMERDERKRYLLTLRERGLVKELGQAHEQLKALSRVDGLTRLYNRRHFQEYLQLIWERACYDGAPVAVLMVDVDHFKKYNDRYGHPAGDECLRQVAQVLMDKLRRPVDLVARYGGEEFIAVLPQSDEAYAMAVAERVRQAVEALQLRHEGSSSALVLTVSVGVASGTALFGQAPESLVARADQALYLAKREGRNRVSLAH